MLWIGSLGLSPESFEFLTGHAVKVRLVHFKEVILEHAENLRSNTKALVSGLLANLDALLSCSLVNCIEDTVSDLLSTIHGYFGDIQ